MNAKRQIADSLDQIIRPVRKRRNDVSYIAVAILEYIGGLRKLTGLPPGGRLLDQQDLIDLMANGTRSTDHVVKGRPVGER